jgi:hypothetical protein
MWSSGFVGAEFGSRADAAPLTLLAWCFSLLATVLVVAALVLRLGRSRRRAVASHRSGHMATRSRHDGTKLGLLITTPALTFPLELGLAEQLTPGEVSNVVSGNAPLGVNPKSGDARNRRRGAR